MVAVVQKTAQHVCLQRLHHSWDGATHKWSVNAVKANWRNDHVANVVLMLTVIAVSWLFVAPLLGPRAAWHFVAKLFGLCNRR